MDSKEAPERKRERIKQEELKKNAAGTLNDSFTGSEAGKPSDFAGGMSWRGTLGVVLFLIIAFILFSYFKG